jgi:hypothetical protein
MLIPVKSKFEAAEGTKLGFTPEIVVKEKLVATLTVKRHQKPFSNYCYCVFAVVWFRFLRPTVVPFWKTQ